MRRRRCCDPPSSGEQLLDSWRRLGMWALRDNLSAYDAGYVALAELLDCALLTADRRLAQAPGIRCAVTVVPR